MPARLSPMLRTPAGLIPLALEAFLNCWLLLSFMVWTLLLGFLIYSTHPLRVPVGGSIPPSFSLHSGGLRERHPVSSRSSALDGSIPPSSPSALGGSIPPSSSLHSGGPCERHHGSSCSNASDGSIPPSSSSHSRLSCEERHTPSFRYASDGSIPPSFSSPSWRSLFFMDRPVSRSSSLQARGSVSMGPHTLAVSSVSPSSPCVLMPHPLPVSRPSFTSFLRMGVGLVHSAQSSQSSSGFRSLAATSSLVNDSLLPSPFTFTFDSGSDTHLLTLEAARSVLSSQELSSLKVLGVSGVPQRADLQGNLILAVQSPHGTVYNLDCGLAHGMRSCPLNLLSVSLLLKKGCTIHFEDGNCYFQPERSGDRIPFRVRDGLFELDARPAESSAASAISCSSAGRSFGAVSGDLTLWHRRVRHMSRSHLLRISKSGAVEGFAVRGKHSLSCPCDTCSMAKIRRQPVPHHRRFSDPASFVGHTVSTDTKSLPFPSVRGYRYVVCYVDHHSRFGLCYFIRSKREVSDTLRRYLADMRHLGITVRTIQSDRGSEFFAQEGDSLADRDRRQHLFDAVCAAQSPPVKHVLRPVEMKEALAENWFREHFRAANSMLWEARLSPVFWADAVQYSQYLFNRSPNSHVGDHTSPFEIVTGQKPRWDRFKVFGCDAFQHIPNNPFYKYPGIPRGRRLLFMGFDDSMMGYKCFDPENRNYVNTANLYFNESFSHRVDALRHHDQRRALLKRGAEQPLQLDDFSDPNSDAVRALYLDPDTPPPPSSSVDSPPVGGAPQAAADHVAAESSPSSGGASGPLSPNSLAADAVQARLSEGVVLRPLRLLPVGKECPFTVDDKAFLDFALKSGIPVVYYQPCPKSKNSRVRYLKYMLASTLREALELGATRDDLRFDYRRGYIRFPKHESILPGHVFHAHSLADAHGVSHVLRDSGVALSRSPSHDASLARVYAAEPTSSSSRSWSSDFHSMLESLYEPEPSIVELLNHRESAERFAELQFRKVLLSSSVDIDFSLPPEPVSFRQVQPDVCPEAHHWRAAMDDEMNSMSRFQVYRRVPKSAATGRQILGCKWVFKRKTNKFGHVTRYRARLVAQGFRQKEFDSFHPDDIHSPVVHKTSLRSLLSVAAAENLHVYTCDVTSAFLQAPLKEKIYLKAPPGFASFTDSGEEEVLELSQAIYGLKQSSSVFYDAMSAHLISKGFEPLLGDPCLFKRINPDGSKIFAAVYVDDITFACSGDAARDAFLAEIRERFVVADGEGAPIEYLLGMAITQDLVAGTIKMSMELPITKLCLSVLSDEELVKSESVDTPMLPTPLRKESPRVVPKSEFDYLSVVGSLLHIANCVRCDISYAVGNLARFSAAPGPAHVRAVKRCLQYLYATRSLGITYSRTSGTPRNMPLMFEGAMHPLDTGLNRLQTFVDSDYAADETRRSTMGGMVMLNGGPISWFSVLGKTVATSTCEAEVNAAVVAAKDAVHIHRLLVDLGVCDGTKPLQIAEDNAACIAQAQAGLRHVRNAKHYEVRLRFLQQLVLDKQIQFKYCPTDLQLADMLTKPLDSTKFLKFRDQFLAR